MPKITPAIYQMMNSSNLNLTQENSNNYKQGLQISYAPTELQ